MPNRALALLVPLALIPSLAAADDVRGRGAMSNDGMSNDGMSNDGMSNDGMSNDGMSNDGSNDAADVGAASVNDAAISTAPGATTTTTTTTSADGTTTTTTTTTSPGGATTSTSTGGFSTTPVANEEESWCHDHYAHGAWRSRMRGRFSIGISKSHIELDDDRGEGHQHAFVARFNGRRGWSIELELAKLSLDGGDTQRTGGVSLVKAFGQRRVAPYVLAGGGGGRYEYADGTEQKLHFGEVGAGVMLRGKRFSIGVDMRRGVRKLRDEDGDAMRTTTPTESDDRDHYTRGRILALFNF